MVCRSFDVGAAAVVQRQAYHTFAEDVDIQLGDLQTQGPGQGDPFSKISSAVRVACDQVQAQFFGFFDQRVAGQRSADRADYGVGFGVFGVGFSRSSAEKPVCGKTVMVLPSLLSGLPTKILARAAIEVSWISVQPRI